MGNRKKLEVLRDLVRDLADPDPCRFDHHGNCQAHGWFDEEHSSSTCPHGRARRLGLVIPD